MLVGIISDTHDNLDKLSKVVGIFNEKGVIHTFHLGDVCSPFAANYLNGLTSPFTGVFGNNDGEWIGINRITKNRFFKPPYYTDIEGYSFILLHEGDIAEYIDEKVDFVLYGHSHNVLVKQKGAQLIINPGTLAGYVSGKSTFAILNLKNRSCEIIKL